MNDKLMLEPKWLRIAKTNQVKHTKTHCEWITVSFRHKLSTTHCLTTYSILTIATAHELEYCIYRIHQPATAGADKARYRRRCIYYIASHWSCKTVCVCGGGGGGCARGAAGATFGKYAGGGCDAVLGGPVYACARYIPSSYRGQAR